MQSRENTGYAITYKEMVQMLYPVPSGYRYNTGGAMKNLRESTTLEKVKNNK